MDFITPGFEALELSTQILIKEAIRNNIEVEVIDWEDNFIALKKGNKTEYVKQATRTSADSYIAPLIMGNKLVTKKILAENGICVPDGGFYNDIETAYNAYPEYRGKSIVIKPKSTNFGLGITILPEKSDLSEFRNAVSEAFTHDSSILIERYIKGNEYRFLVIDGEVIAVLRRVPANVTGDGIKTIKSLIDEKNEDSLRGVGYKSPLEKIKKGKEEKDFLQSQKMDMDYVPAMGEQVFLRKNSNISTGGDSIDFTDEVSGAYKEIAVKAANAVGAKICGADIIIPDIKGCPFWEESGSNYGVIELNFNPAIHIHEFPWKGRKHYSEKKILNLLGF